MNSKEKLLMEVKALADKYNEIYKKTGGYFNIFSILNVERKEVDTHSRFLYDLLNPLGSHCLGDKYLRLFVDNVLKLKLNDEDFSTAKVFREYSFDEGGSRIDILIITKNFCIPIEVKIDARDQKRQIQRYYNYAKNSGKISKVYYLTLDGHEPSENSLGALYRDSDLKSKMTEISFETEILQWLNLCVREEETLKISVLREIILQYISLIKKITNQSEEGFKMETVNLILSSKDNFKSALEIEKGLITAKAEKMKQIYKTIDKFITEKLNLKRISETEEKEIEKYFNNKKTSVYPGMTYKVIDIDSKQNMGLYLEFETNQNLYMGLSIAVSKDNQLEYLKPEKYKDLLEKYVNSSYVICDNTWICWNYILNSKGETYDFKTFSSNIIEFDEKENLEEIEFFLEQIKIQYNKYMNI